MLTSSVKMKKMAFCSLKKLANRLYSGLKENETTLAVGFLAYRIKTGVVL